MSKILFVCLGNICRSPTAEAVLRTLSNRAGLDLTIESAGIGGWHHGEPPDTRARAAGEARGYSFAGQNARQVRAQDFAEFDFIFAMDNRNLEDLRALCPKNHAEKLSLFLDYALNAAETEIPDPYYGGDAGFEHVIDLIEAASHGLIAALKKS